MSTLFLIFAGLIQFCSCEVSSSDLNDLFLRNIDLISENFDHGFYIYQNISQAAISSVSKVRSTGQEYLEDIVDEYSDRYQEIKDKAKVKNVDIDACLTFFEFNHVDTEVFDGCIYHGIDEFIKEISDKHNKYWQHYLKALYRMPLYLADVDFLEKKSDFLFKQLKDVAILGVSQKKYLLHSDEKELLTTLKKVGGCVDTYAEMIRIEHDANLLGFEACVDGTINWTENRM